MKRLVMLTAVLLMTVGLLAQSFFTPVTADQLRSGEKALTGTFLIRPEFTVAGNVIKPVFIEDKFSSFEVSFATRIGFGASYSLYKLVNDQPYNLYSFAAQLSLATAERPNMGILLTASAFDLYGLSPSVGIGYDFVKDSPIKQNWFLMWGLGKTF